MNTWCDASFRPGSAGWRDQLVDLHVLAAHGDLEAADRAQAWLAADGAARQAWDQVQRVCDDLHNAPPLAVAAREGRP
jgi:ferric-dicitrate binding protein FerR (iron transport regulator)